MICENVRREKEEFIERERREMEFLGKEEGESGGVRNLRQGPCGRIELRKGIKRIVKGRISHVM